MKCPACRKVIQASELPDEDGSNMKHSCGMTLQLCHRSDVRQECAPECFNDRHWKLNVIEKDYPDS